MSAFSVVSVPVLAQHNNPNAHALAQVKKNSAHKHHCHHHCYAWLMRWQSRWMPVNPLRPLRAVSSLSRARSPPPSPASQEGSPETPSNPPPRRVPPPPHPQGWGTEGWEAQNFAFFPLPPQFRTFSLPGGRWCLKRRGPEMCTFGVLGLHRRPKAAGVSHDSREPKRTYHGSGGGGSGRGGLGGGSKRGARRGLQEGFGFFGLRKFGKNQN